MDIEQFHKYVVRPTLEVIGLQSLEAERLLIGTALVESRLHYIQQVKGPAAGLYQMEPATHDDIWKNFLAYKPALSQRVDKLLFSGMDKVEQLRVNMAYATAMCRVHYFRSKDPLPRTPEEMALYHKRYYNTVLGKTDPKESVEYFRQAERLVK